MAFFTYIVASQRNGTLYIGHTDELWTRVGQHKARTFKGFTAKYGVDLLVWYETYGSRDEAFRVERQMKKWNRAWKIELIERFNPERRDLHDEILAWKKPGSPPSRG